MTPRELLDARNQGGFGKEDVRWSAATDWAALLPTEQDELLWEVRGALVHHEVSRAFRRAFDDANQRRPRGTPKTTRPAFAERWHYNPKRMEEAFRGQVRLDATELALIVKAFGPSALPVPSDLTRTLVRVARSAAAHPDTHTGVLRLENAWDLERLMDGLGEMGGFTVALPFSEAEKKALTRHPPLARRIAHAACKRLRDRPGVAQDWESYPGGWVAEPTNNTLDIELARDEGGKPGARGTVHNDGYSIEIWLASDWEDKVHAPGHAVLDDWLVLDVTMHDPQGRPIGVTVLDLLPEEGIWTRDDDGRLAEDNWEYMGTPAKVDWSTGSPVVTVPADPEHNGRP
jgi:hypothetical protein